VDRVGNMMGGRLLASVIPVMCGIIGAFVDNLPISIMGPWVPSPLFSLMPLYYWCLVRPDLMTPAWAFLIGATEDILSGGPPGVWAASFVATYAIVDRQRDAFAGLSGWGAMLGFATAALVACSTAYAIMLIHQWSLLPLTPVLGTFAMTVLFYAIAAVVLGAVHHRLVGPMRSDF